MVNLIKGKRHNGVVHREMFGVGRCLMNRNLKIRHFLPLIELSLQKNYNLLRKQKISKYLTVNAASNVKFI